MQKQRRRKTQVAPAQRLQQSSSYQSYFRKNAIYWVVAAISSLALALVLRFLPPSTEREEENRSRSLDSTPKQTMQPPPAVKKAKLQLPLQVRPFDTKIEKEDLLARLDKALDTYEKKAPIHYVLALTYSELLQTEKALAHFRDCLKLDPNNVSAIADYSKQLTQLGKYPEVVELITPRIKAGSNEPRIHAELGNAYLQSGEIEQACSVLENAVRLFPNDGTILLRSAQAEVQRGNFEVAEKNARAALSVGEKSDGTYMVLSTALIRLGKREEALAVRQEQSKIPKSDGNDDEKYRESFRQFACHTYGMLAGIVASQGDIRNAEKWYLYGLRLDPLSIRNLVGLGTLFQKAGRTRDSLAVYQRLAEVEPENPVNFNNLASLAISLQEMQLAEQALRRLVKLDSTGNADLVYADFCFQNRDTKRSAKHAKIAAMKTKRPDAYALWIAALQREGRAADAADAIQQARVQFPSDLRFKTPL